MQDLSSLSMLHRVEEVQGPWACRCFAVYFLPGPPFWRLPQAPQSSLGAQEGSLRDAGQALGGHCGLPLAGTPGCGSSGRCPVGTAGGLVTNWLLVSDTRAVEMRRQPPLPGAPQQELQLPYSPSGGDDSWESRGGEGARSHVSLQEHHPRDESAERDSPPQSREHMTPTQILRCDYEDSLLPHLSGASLLTQIPLGQHHRRPMSLAPLFCSQWVSFRSIKTLRSSVG